jgi:hypothetical protein
MPRFIEKNSIILKDHSRTRIGHSTNFTLITFWGTILLVVRMKAQHTSKFIRSTKNVACQNWKKMNRWPRIKKGLLHEECAWVRGWSHQFISNPLASPVVIVWKVMDHHLFLNIIPNNFMTQTGHKVRCDRTMNVQIVQLTFYKIMSMRMVWRLNSHSQPNLQLFN